MNNPDRTLRRFLGLYTVDLSLSSGWSRTGLRGVYAVCVKELLWKLRHALNTCSNRPESSIGVMQVEPGRHSLGLREAQTYAEVICQRHPIHFACNRGPVRQSVRAVEIDGSEMANMLKYITAQFSYVTTLAGATHKASTILNYRSDRLSKMRRKNKSCKSNQGSKSKEAVFDEDEGLVSQKQHKNNSRHTHPASPVVLSLRLFSYASRHLNVVKGLVSKIVVG